MITKIVIYTQADWSVEQQGKLVDALIKGDVEYDRIVVRKVDHVDADD